MTNIEQHFKERDPNITIEIIKNFFKNKGFQLEEDVFRESEIGTFSNRYELIKDEVIIQGANGKGMTPEYCRASALGELYERYCSFCTNSTNNFFMNTYFKYANLKQISYEEIINEPFIKDYFFTLFKNNENETKTFIENRFGPKYYGKKFINLFTNEEKYFDIRFIDLINSTAGLSAGNTYDEAINQALSELVQRRTELLFFAQPQDIYYNLNLSTIKNPKILQLINNIKKLNYDFYIIDLSYNFHFPVLMSILINKKEKNIEINFGSFPVIDIALERIITELYQGITSFKRFRNNEVMTPYKEISYEKVLRTNFSTYAFLKNFPEDFFNKLKISNYNKDIFLEGNYQNEFLKDYFLKLLKNNNLTPYLTDYSQTKDMKAIRILIPEINFKDYLISNYYNYNYQFVYNYCINNYKFTNMIQQNIDNNELILFYKNKCLSLLSKDTLLDRNFLCDLTFADPLTPFGINPKGTLDENFKELLDNPVEPIIIQNNFDTIFYPFIKKYLTLKKYIRSGKYSKQEIKDFFKILGEEITERDFLNINNFDYLFEQIYLIPIKNFIFSDEYKNLILTITGLT